MTNVTDGVSLPDFDPAVVIDLDVRPDIAAGREPFERIFAAAESLPPAGVLHLRSPFKPVPLFRVLGARGFSYHCESFAADDWSTWFWREASPPPPSHPVAREPAPEGVIDLRQLPAPEPLVAIMARISRDETPFDVLLPFDPDMLPVLLARHGWRVERVSADAAGTRLRISRTEGAP